MRINKAFISAAGIDEKLGVTCANHYEVETKRAVMQSSDTRSCSRIHLSLKGKDCLFGPKDLIGYYRWS